MVHASNANMFTYPLVKSASKAQIGVETKSRETEWGHKERDCLLAYSEVRREMIKEYAPSLDKIEVERIAINTRGLMWNDIIKGVHRYVASKESPKLIEHPTNTCDPYTGN